MAKSYFSLLGLKGGQMKTSASPSETPSPTSQRGEKWDLNEDRPEGGPAGPKSPGRGIVFPVEQAGGKGDRHASAAGSAVFPAGPHSPASLQALRPPPPAADSLFWALRQVTEERPPHQLSALQLFSPDGRAVLQRVTAWVSHLLCRLKGAVWF